jgi:hypothetical protein
MKTIKKEVGEEQCFWSLEGNHTPSALFLTHESHASNLRAPTCTPQAYKDTQLKQNQGTNTNVRVKTTTNLTYNEDTLLRPKVETPYHDNDLILTPIISTQSG